MVTGRSVGQDARRRTRFGGRDLPARERARAVLVLKRKEEKRHES